MGIYDREYVRVGPRSKSGLGSLRFISFNSWLIIINVAVFLADVALMSRPVPVVIEMQPMSLKIQDPNLALSQGYYDAVGNPIPEWVVTAERDPATGRVRPVPSARKMRNPALRAGTQVFKPVVDRRTGETVGRASLTFMSPLAAYGHFSTFYAFERFEMWRYITFQFLHGGVLHLFFNMFGLWVFGGMVEQYLGFKRYAAFYLTCGIFGAVTYLLLNLLGAVFNLQLPGVLFHSTHVPLVGASAGVFGVIIACAFIAPNAIVQLLFPPVPLPLKWFAYGYVALAAWNLLRGGANAGGDAAHIGGAIAGFFFVRNAHLLRDFFDIFGNSNRPREADAIDEGEVDRILAKVGRDGLASLSERERRTLRRASDRRKRA